VLLVILVGHCALVPASLAPLPMQFRGCLAKRGSTRARLVAVPRFFAAQPAHHPIGPRTRLAAVAPESNQMSMRTEDELH
jgi:hypothetical protein